MKRKVLLGILFVALLVVATGCGKDNAVKTLNCKFNLTQGGMKVESNYKVSYRGKDVTLIETTEKMTADDPEDLDAYKETIEDMYSPYKDVKYYDYSVTVDGDTLTSVTSINYEHINTDDLIKINSAIASILDNGKLKVKDVQDMYETLGAICK